MKKRVLVSVGRGETKVAILEPDSARERRKTVSGSQKKEAPSGPVKPKPESGWHVAELYIERRSRRSIVGNIYKGKVQNVLPGLEASFVDIDVEKNGFLHVDEVVVEGKSVRGRGRRRIGDLLKDGQEVVVQVIKDPLKTKGARLSMQLSIPGRFMVFMPTGEGVGVSRRLVDSERQRLRKLGEKLDVERGGVIMRTAATGATLPELKRELKYLYKLEEILDSRAKSTVAPALVFQEADLPVRVIRDIASKEFEWGLVDDEKQYGRVSSFLSLTAPEIVERVVLDTSRDDIFERFEVERALQSVMSRRVDLPSGGYLMIDYAEALTVIDINTGSFIGRGKTRLEDTITKTNVEAAEEVVRQLRLRDIGGIIVIDFIDMERARNRDLVRRSLEKHLQLDRTKTYVVDISPLGLVEMTRQNVTEGVREILTKPCPTCHAEGVVFSEETLAIDLQRRLRDLARDSKAEAFLVNVHPRVAAILIGGGGKPLSELERETGKHFLFEGIEAAPLDTYSVTAEGTLGEIERRALPFEQGDEVLLDIEEPHMYNAEDGIAKVDGYVISISGGAPFVGAKKLVRIDQVRRTVAYGSLADTPVPDEAASKGSKPSSGTRQEATGDAKQVESQTRNGTRRPGGRRSGRRKPAAPRSAGGTDSDMRDR